VRLTQTYVLETFDVDCDTGIEYAWHRFKAEPGSFSTPMEAMALAGKQFGDTSRVLTLDEFMETIYPEMDDFGKMYWHEEGYANTDSLAR
jgi:hypothetical protein